MKKKLFLTLVLAFAFVIALSVSVFADSIHNENTVDYSAKVTLDDGTELNLFDSEGNALIWYISGKEDGKNVYSSVRADSSDVSWKAETWDEVQAWGVTGVDKKNVVVVNMMDDDVIRNTGYEKYLNKPVDSFKFLFQYMTSLEYCYLRLDTKTINNGSFTGCTKLKYINLEDLTQYSRSAQHNQFNGCTSLFEGQVLDLTKTKLYEFEGSETFKGVPLKGIKFPETMKKIGSGGAFTNCTNLEFISIGNKAILPSNAFSGCTSLKAIYYVGTLDELNASTVLAAVTDENVKSYAEYKALSDKSGLYVVYDYSRCEAFNGGVHGEASLVNNCVGNCTVCGDTVVNHNDDENLSVTINYTNYGVAGEKTAVCCNEGCGYEETVSAPALIVCDGYSIRENGGGKFVVGFYVNNKAIEKYEEITNKTVNFGVFAVLQNKLGENDVLDESGALTCNGIKAPVSDNQYSSIELILGGFESTTQKALSLCLGVYFEVTSEDESVEYSYVQNEPPQENEKYSFTSYDAVFNG